MHYTNNIFKLDKSIIKVSNPVHDQYLDRKNENIILKYLQKNDFSFLAKTENVYFTSNILVSRFKRIEDFSHFNHNNTSFYQSLIRIIQAFHKINIKDVKTFNYHDFFYNLYNKILDKNIPINLVYLDKIIKKLSKVKNKVFSHNDLVPNNILVSNKDKKIYIIDYDYAMNNNYLFDYASFLCESIENQIDVNNYISSLKKLNIINSKNMDNFIDEIYYQDRLWIVWAKFCYELTNDNIFLDIYTNKVKKMTSRNINVND
ncbi:phosphotransferase [Spiroplasma endosymbiont of Aspidapion aeneum]|uniref:phosphotransferase n=1 Tax=Spiroplasma endosymbiont of Aspidapion aeneum TaxID=3066276 RepID=UPI00313F2F27